MSSGISYAGTWVATHVQSYLPAAAHKCMQPNTLFTKPLGGTITNLEGGLVGIAEVLVGLFVVIAIIMAIAHALSKKGSEWIQAIVKPVVMILVGVAVIWIGGILWTVITVHCTTPFG